ncbi:MAG: glycosyl hydrolase 115 family protein [Akkermansiaceae bacterium]|nr:glycosyl hydrolase 115 family protein [Akkermansiaceae bacterium]
MKPAVLILFPVLLARLAAAPLDIAPDGGFPLVAGGSAAKIVTDGADHAVVSVAANCLADDVARVTGSKVSVSHSAPDGPQVIIGTLGRSKFIDHLAASGAIETRNIRGKWESCVITTITEPRPALVIAGSDPRGTAYGVFEVSRKIGVSPWVWWADAAPENRETLRLESGALLLDSPAVKYRGIFLNDEDWGLQPWAAKTFEPEVGNIGPKTYAKIFELMLRLRANTIWPAMHECTTAFHQVPGNNETADRYAIVLGSSHAEPMLRNNVGEWKKPKDHYNYLRHPDIVRDYWEERVKQRTKGESIFTLGMRGIHDSAIVGPKNQKERIATLETIFADQRKLLAKHLGKPLAEIGQMFCPYKEVLPDYQAGLKVPDDVTLVWPDDNFGYVRHFPTDAENKRSGGSGVYYHLSYLGSPMSWMWFDSLPPAFVWSEMRRAYDYGARSIWIANVGDIKGNEMSTEWFLDLAWNADEYGPESGMEFLKRFAATNFGAENAEDIADLWARHQQLAFARKPEHLQWNLPLTPYQPSEMTDREILDRLEAYRLLKHDAAEVCQALPEHSKDAAFQLIAYPIACAAAANLRYFGLELARRGHDAEQVEAAKSADREIAELTRRYNEGTAGGKWKHIMTSGGLSPKDWLRFQPTRFDQQLKEIAAADAKKMEETKPASPPAGLKGPAFYERDGVISMNAGNFTRKTDHLGGGWRRVPGLGRTGSAITLVPSTTQGAPEVSYRFHVSTGGPATLHFRILPTHPTDNGGELSLTASIDGSPAQVLRAKDFDPKTKEWQHRVLSNSLHLEAGLGSELTPGWHDLRVTADRGIALDKIVIDLGGLKPSYDGPAETRFPE